MKERIALFPGSFNPFTLGHADIVERGLWLFDKVVIAIGYNEHKSAPGSMEERLSGIRRVYAGNPSVEVISYSGLTVDMARRLGAVAILRGARNNSDFEYERNLADVNREIAGIETVILVSRPELSFVSGSMARELQHNGYDISRYLPAESGKVN